MLESTVLIVPTPDTLELVEYAIVFIEIAKFASQMVVDRDRLYRPGFHIDIPDLE